jgi:hypothetical protein
MTQILEAIVNFFNEDEWPSFLIEGKPALSTGFKGDNGLWACYAQAREKQEQFVFYSICSVSAPENKRLAMAEFLTRANYDLPIGNFELSFSDGKIRYKTSIDVEGDRLSTALIKNMIYANVLTMDRYLPGIISVIYGDVSPAQAIVKIEGESPLAVSSPVTVLVSDDR